MNKSLTGVVLVLLFSCPHEEKVVLTNGTFVPFKQKKIWSLRNWSLSVYEYTYSTTWLVIEVSFIMRSIIHVLNLPQHNCSTISKPHCNSGSINSDQCAPDDSTAFTHIVLIYEAASLKAGGQLQRGVSHNEVSQCHLVATLDIT